MQEQMIHPQTYALLKGKQPPIYYKTEEVRKEKAKQIIQTICRYYKVTEEQLKTILSEASGFTNFREEACKSFTDPSSNQYCKGVYDYLIVCDDRNNPPEVIDANELVVDIYIKPVRTAEVILVNFRATRTGAHFQEIVR